MMSKFKLNAKYIPHILCPKPRQCNQFLVLFVIYIYIYIYTVPIYMKATRLLNNLFFCSFKECKTNINSNNMKKEKKCFVKRNKMNYSHGKSDIFVMFGILHFQDRSCFIIYKPQK